MPQQGSPLFGTILPPSNLGPARGEQGLPSAPMDFSIPATTANLTGMHPPLPPPWGPIGTPWTWNQYPHGPGQAGPATQAPISSHPTCPPPPGWGCRQPGPMPWAHGLPPPPLFRRQLQSSRALCTFPKTPWQGYPRPPVNRGLSGIGLGAGLYSEMDLPPPPPHPLRLSSYFQPFTVSFFPPAPTLGPSSLPWATSSLPQRSTPGPIAGFSPSSGPTVPPSAPYPGWTPRTAQQHTGGATSFNTGTRDIKWDAGAPQPPSVSSRFSFSDATVQGKEYYVHRHFFEKHSPFFEKLLSSFPLHSEWPIPPPASLAGGVREAAQYLLPLLISPIPVNLATVEEWTSILELSTFWDFKQLRARSIKELTDITSPIDRIVLAQAYNVPEWTLSGYRALVMRRKPVTAKEAEKLGMQAVLKVWQVQTELNSRTHLCPGACCLPLVDGLVRAEFGLA
ncbi:hypothetical protein BKA70DRAFT_1424881 [Coprinopsis sp. MPI-PUGE-AT-0042]|nr:hypothetical protein BKA70DRAFT_1424881 [Coprinopsis sp. MPI-PUGE-AT-0042]